MRRIHVKKLLPRPISFLYLPSPSYGRLITTISRARCHRAFSTKFRAAASIDKAVEKSLTRLSLSLSSLPPESPSGIYQISDNDVLNRPSPEIQTYHLPLHLKDLLAEDAFDLLTKYFADPPYNQTLHPYYFAQLLKNAIDVLKKRPAVVALNCDFERVHVVGDLHGSLPDLISALKASDVKPSERDAFIFNGDFVDRGQHGVEVLSALLALLAAAPDAIYLNRGNHEDAAVSGAYGFREELETKMSHAMWPAVQEFFSLLPLATLIPRKMCGGALVVHAGVSSHSGALGSLTKGGASVVKEGSRVTDMLWSDPDVDVLGLRDNESRGAGKFYGVDVARAALDELDLSFFVRSHQQVHDGVERTDLGGGKSLYTVFSVTDYPNFEGCNRGGILTFSAASSSPIPSRYSSEELPMTASASRSVHYEMTNLGASLLHTIRLHRADLHSRLIRSSSDGRRVTSDQWRTCMSEATGLDVEWDEIERLVAPHVKRFNAATKSVEDTELIDVEHFLLHFDGAGVEKAEAAFSRGRELYVLFKRLDVDGSGGLSKSEFARGVELLNENLLEGEKVEGDIDELFDVIDVDKNGVIDIEEWRGMLK